MKIKLKQKDILLVSMICGVSLYYALKYSNIYINGFKLILFFSELCGLIYIFLKKRVTRSGILLCILLFMLSALFFFFFENYSIWTIILFMMAGSEADLDMVINSFFWSNLVWVLILQILRLARIDNTLGIQAGVIILLYICCRKGNLRNKEYILLLAGCIVITFLSESKSFGIITVLGLGLLFVSRYKWVKRMLLSGFTRLIFIICFLADYFASLCVGESKIPIIGKLLPEAWESAVISMFKLLDISMSWRLTLTYKSLRNFGISMWGGNIDVDSLNIDEYSYFYLDSGYANMLQRWGIVFTIIFLILMTIIIDYFFTRRRYDLIISSICLALWMINEPIINIVSWNFIIVFGGKAINNLRLRKRRKKLA